MPTVINGLPAHILLVHVIIVLIPLGALFTVLSALWPAAHEKLGFISPLTCLIALIFVPITTHAGDWLRSHIHVGGATAARVNQHADLGHQFLWYAILLFVVSAAVWWLGRTYGMALRPARVRADRTGTTIDAASGGGTATATRTRVSSPAKTKLPQWASIAVAVVAIAVAAVVVWQLYRVGDAGSRAVWDGVTS